MVANVHGPQFSGGANIAIKCPAHTYEQTVAFYRDTLTPFVNKIPLGLGRLMLGTVLGAAEMFRDPQAAALHHPVFELRPPN